MENYVDPIREKALAELKKLEGVPLATKYTADGEVVVRMVCGERVEFPLEEVEFTELPSDFKTRHDVAMRYIAEAIEAVKAIPNRLVPLTRNEIIPGIKIKDFRYLCRVGYVQERIIRLVDASGKPKFCKPIVYFTPQGRAYVKKFLL